MKENQENKSLTINQEAMDVIVANVIPTTKYFESRFDFMQHQIDEIKKSQKEMKQDIDERFDKVDKRFEQIDKKFDKVDKKFEIITNEIHNLTLEVRELGKKQEVTIRDYIIERDRHYDQKFARHRSYFLAISGIIVTIMLKMAGIINFPIINSTINSHQSQAIISNQNNK